MITNFDEQIRKEFQSILLEGENIDHLGKFKFFLESHSINHISEERKLNELFGLKKYILLKNLELQNTGYFIGKINTLETWRESQPCLNLYIIGFVIRFYFFIIRRVLPRVRFVYKLNSFFFRKNNRLISRSEIMGRFIYSGFEITLFEKVYDSYFFVVKKVSEPKFTKVSTGIFFSMSRIGKNGKEFKIYKLRTMHPYSEFLQNYMIENFGYSSNGKLNNDFRMTNWARFFRKYWLDELPQIWNVIKGDMKLVGIRPVTLSYFNKIPLEHQKERVKFKPGCIPPYLALNLNSDKESVLMAERIYIKLIKRKPIIIDFVFFFNAFRNIIFFKRRSH
jgi:lipopolysaccharide/colanic/teichoic acid biosynthesis glycosyltransferase